jgi:putative phosphoesterase
MKRLIEMIIGILSDTHIPTKAKVLPKIVLDRLKGADHILHAGDISQYGVLKELEKLAPVTAVAGNTDPLELLQLLGEKKILSMGTFKIGLCHGHGTKGDTLRRALFNFAAEQPDCIVFGHSHMPYCRKFGSVLMINPGSPTDKRKNPYYAFSILEIDRDIKPQLFLFDRDQVVRHFISGEYTPKEKPV